MPEDPLSLRLYRWLLKLYPAGFHENSLIADVAVSVPLQFSCEVTQDARHMLRLWARRPWHTGFAILWNDIRYGIRMLAANPGFSAVAILSLAIGIGANTGVFSVVNALLLRSLPFRDPARLAYLSSFFEPHDSAKQFQQWRSRSTYLGDAAIFEQIEANLGGAGEWRQAHVVQASSNFFSVLGTQPMLGCGFAAGDDVDATGWGSPGRNAIAVIGFGLWQELFAGGP